jgi:hypothetical protein
MVFIPWEAADLVRAQGQSGHTSIEVVACEPSLEGLRVEGHVAPRRLVTVAVVAVSGSELDQAGVRVGFNNLADQGDPGTTSGDFRITLPWADEGSLFALVDKGSVIGGVAACPR